MLRIKVELVPGGNELRAREIARALLGNVSDLADRSDYEIEAREGANTVAGTQAWESMGHILAHDRWQTVWALVEKAATWARREAELADRQRPQVETSPQSFPESIVDRVRRVAGGGGRIAMKVVDLTDEELEAIGQSCSRCGAPTSYDWKFCPMCGDRRK